MHKSLQERYKVLQGDTKLMLKEVASLSSSSYHFQPESGGWSISQILTHLLVAEKLSVEYIKKKMQGIDELEDAGLYEDAKMVILRLSQRLPFKFKAPDVVVQKTPAAMSFGDLVRQWEVVRADTVTVLEQFDETTLKRKVYKHPVAGMLSVGQAIDFFREHLNHHRPQVLRIIHDLRKSPRA